MEGLPRGRYGTIAEDREEDNWVAPLSSLRMVLVGKTGTGRSATGNSILCQPVFESRLGTQPVTKMCQGETGTWNGRNILVVDTPPIFEAEAQTDVTYKDIGDCYLLSAPGPHVLLLVTQLGRFTAQDAAAVRKVKEVFGAGAMKHVVVVFTHKEDLEGKSLDDYIAHTDNERLRSLMQECGRRFCGFNNRATGEQQREQLAELMAVVGRLERENEGAFLSNDLFREALRLQRGGRGTHGDEHRRYLLGVWAQVEKQRRELRDSWSLWARRAPLTVRRGMLSYIVITAVLITCILIFLATLIYLDFIRGH